MVVVVIRVSTPAGSCECRSDEPFTPASKPESSSTETKPRTVQSGFYTADVAFVTLPASSSARPISPNGSPPKAPLYLLTSHLLI